MILNLNKKIVRKFIETNEQNILIDNIYNDFFENYSRNISSKELHSFPSYYSLFLNKLEIDGDDKEFKNLAHKYQLNHFSKLDYSKYQNNPYNKNIHLDKDIKHDNLLLTKSSFTPFQAFIYQDISVDKESYYREINHLGYFEESFSYIDLVEKDVTWMSITPHEIETMEGILDEAKGNILVLGLGLGYYPYMASLKKDVTSITVIELNEDIIDIFKNNILNQFDNKQKIKIINEDAINYLLNTDLTKFDYVFTDLWHTPEDAFFLYIRIYNILSKTNIKSSFWIENSILSLLRRMLITLIEENIENYKEEDYLKTRNQYDKLINKLYFKTKEEKISSEEEMYKFLSDENIKKLIID